MLKKTITILIAFCLIFEQSGFAQVISQLVLPAFTKELPAPDTFRPEHLRSISFETQENNFRTLLDKGTAKENDPVKLENSTRQLFKYFFTGLSLPNESFWVNLRPDSPDNIIDEQLARTDVGKIMLEADVQLKKDTAKYTSPDTAEGRAYWDKLYRKAEELFKSENISIPALTRPWIVPDEIILRQSAGNAYIYKATLKVMLEADHLKNNPEYKFDDPRMKDLNDYSSQLIRELVLPRLSREVNTSRRYAPLRQVYFSLILAQWFKDKVIAQKSIPALPIMPGAGLLGYDLVAAKIDSRDLSGLISQSPWSKETYFKEYQKSFNNGEYNKQENIQSAHGLSVRQYFSGGVKFSEINRALLFDGGIQAKAAIDFILSNTEPKIVKTIPGNPFEIEYIQAGALQSGGLPLVGNTNLPPGAPVLISKDGGYEMISDPQDLIRYAEKVLRKPGAKLKIWMDVDNVIFDHKLSINDTVFYPTQDFVSERINQIKAFMSEEEYQKKQKDILRGIIKECVFWEKRWFKARKLKKIEGLKEILDYVESKNTASLKIEVGLITNRPDDLELMEITINILESLGIKKGVHYSDIIFVGAGNGKAEKIREKTKDEHVFFVDNNRQNVESIAGQFKDLAQAKIFYLNRTSKEGKFFFEDLMEMAELLLISGLKNPEEIAAVELFLGCASLEISKLVGRDQPEKIAEIRSFMQSFGLDRTGPIDRTYIDLCLEDIERGIYFGELRKLLFGGLESREKKNRAEALFINAIKSISGLEGAERKARLMDLRNVFEEFRPAHRDFFEAFGIGKHLEELSVRILDSKAHDIENYIREKMNNVDPELVDLASESSTEAAQKIARAAKSGRFIVLDLKNMPVSYLRAFQAIHKFGDVAREIKKMLPESGSGELDYYLQELFKNAFYHGNKLDFHLPVYFYFTLNEKGEIETVEVYDKGAKEFPSAIDKSLLLEKKLVGKGVGVHDIVMGGWEYERFKFSGFSGSMVMITRKDGGAEKEVQRKRIEVFISDRKDKIINAINSRYGSQLSGACRYELEYLASGTYRDVFKVIFLPDNGEPLFLVMKTIDKQGRRRLVENYDERDEEGQRYEIEPAGHEYAAERLYEESTNEAYFTLEEYLAPVKPKELSPEQWLSTVAATVRAYMESAQLTNWNRASREFLFPFDVKFDNVGYTLSGRPLVKVLDMDLARRYTPLKLMNQLTRLMGANSLPGTGKAVIRAVKDALGDSADAFLTDAAEELKARIQAGELTFNTNSVHIVWTETRYRPYTHSWNLDNELYAELGAYAQLPVLISAQAKQDGGIFQADGKEVEEILKENLSSIARGEQGTFGTVVDAKKAWKIFRAKYNGEVGDLSREFARQIAQVQNQENSASKVQELIDLLNNEDLSNKEEDCFIFVSESGEVQGVMRMYAPEFGSAKLDKLAAIPDLNKRIGTTLLDTFFRILNERSVKEASIVSFPDAVKFYYRYLEQKGITSSDYTYSAVSFRITGEGIKKIASAIRADRGAAVREILKQNPGLIAVKDSGVSGTVVDAKEAWGIFQENDDGKVGDLSREFARQIALVDPESIVTEPDKRGESEKSKIQEAINHLSGKDSEHERTGFFIFVSRQGDVQGMMRFSIYKPGKGILNRLWIIPELRQTGNGIGTILLDRFFQELREKDAQEAIIPSMLEAVDFYTKYLDRKGVKRQQDYEISKVDQIFYARYFTISRPSIIKISASAKQDGGTAAPGGIDLRRLPVYTETQVSSQVKVMPEISGDPRSDVQWRDIQELVSKGFLPESGRIKECLRLYRASGVLPVKIESLLACLAEILRKEEDLCLPIDPALKELLVLLESN